jgi:hypothetical protein
MIRYLDAADWQVTNTDLVVTERTKFHNGIERVKATIATVQRPLLPSVLRDVATLKDQLDQLQIFEEVTQNRITKASEVLEYIQMRTHDNASSIPVET